MRTQVPGVDPAAVEMWRRVGGQMGATHTHGTTAEMRSAATHAHGATAKMGATATTEVSAATTAAKVTAAASAANMATTAAPETTAASGISNCRQTKGKAYCGHACCDFPHDTTSSSGPNAESQRQIARSVPADSKSVMLQCTRRPVHVAHRHSCAQFSGRARPLRLKFFSHAITIAGIKRRNGGTAAASSPVTCTGAGCVSKKRMANSRGARTVA
jgi:hypothetical protein